MAKNSKSTRKVSAPVIDFNVGVPAWQLKLSMVLRVLILASGIYNLFFGDIVFGFMTTLCWLLIMLPGFFTRNFIKRLPIEFEILFFIIVFFQFILGHVHDFYAEVPYYDKFVHLFLPLLLGLISFVLLFTMYATGKLKASIGFIALLAILIAIAIGALWEICEYLFDQILYGNLPNWPHFQGNGQQDALTDTMTDLMFDTVGGIIGAFLAVWFIGRLENKNVARLNALTKEIASNFVKPQGKKSPKKSK